ncbi:MAG: hypothetical protein PHT14_09895 [Petrimonas sp.]|jgi:hypothetical protein|uniref:hypothetical protein n=1 Tax=Petrimonas TaxID=307628 RepID=UPI00257A567F|nr:hypothetical protein [Proteiniphilum sp. UBA5218]MDD2312843.1 hypothetical protein [Petrimonas sp.]MDD2910053.1 hypothetical protein [Petrimonas sp.]MDD3541788.1 hypothetical protein [Petrimonas sp.]MDX9775138.1 hypothetical protein [Petrimonas sp.]MEA5071780.1 hypothetical protein [Petrimonas sp.]
MKKISLLAALLFFSLIAVTQEKSFIVLRDIHYDLIEDHDMDWLKTKPDDVRQVKEYTQVNSRC